MTFVLGLTGSIGMGKSATAAMFRARGIPVHDADATVHALYRGPAVAPIEAAFPGVASMGRVDRARLAAQVLDNDQAMRRLEAIVHPLVREAEEEFLAGARRAGRRLAVLDIPLLFETGSERRCQAVVVVSAPPAVQRERALARPGMTAGRLATILDRQMPDAQKRRRAHVVIDTGRGWDAAQMQVDDLIRALAGCCPPRLADRSWREG
jgi:dephospho-CoA kinase